MIDMRTLESRDIRYERMGTSESIVHVILDQGVGLPLERQEGVVDE